MKRILLRWLLPKWTPELERELRKIYHSAPPKKSDGGSLHTGIQAVYNRLKEG